MDKLKGLEGIKGLYNKGHIARARATVNGLREDPPILSACAFARYFSPGKRESKKESKEWKSIPAPLPTPGHITRSHPTTADNLGDVFIRRRRHCCCYHHEKLHFKPAASVAVHKLVHHSQHGADCQSSKQLPLLALI